MDANTIDSIFKALVIGGVITQLATVFQLKGRFEQFMTNHWPHFLDDFEELKDRVRDLERKS